MDEKRDYNKILEFLEDEHRHDLALHLFSAHLLHRVNPSFPQKKWSSWPMGRSKVPEVHDVYEDSIEDQKRVQYEKMNPEPVDEQFAMSFKRSQSNMMVAKKKSKDLPNAVLVNAINDIVEQTIKRKLSQQKLSLDLDHKLSANRALSLRIADRVSRTLWRLQKRNAFKTSKMSANNWQDVQIANVLGRSRTDKAPIESYRRSYETARSLFMERHEQYQYDDSPYGSEAETDSDNDPNFVMTAPEFEVEHHLEAIDKEATMPSKQKTDPQAELAKRKVEFQTKEAIFTSCWDDAASTSVLSFAPDNSVPYKVHSGPLSEEREDILATNVVNKKDYQIHFTK
ncbi:hypothetical protein FT663_03045 [Candidozyma haemuli var. vulneris]|uniref:Rrn9 domain-containing protein n=1 Tax=Candidozyma haemuli TaxID=45357 RepID=A0A2V1ASR4_9ASCO|nr:hypothetical protein CXQ85_001758 [[Candida] haemuloni]KAF3986661.1 hypothetical protein FT662_04442 [[Candida] haemuloni var. vulneris]KAF3990779.1 hypothetical protein FT663_03045 [[Candida] haemuloni var. vulneris]PVH19981.1 hypothetical protein CXQ85_001758 [[Candida] haemuloni]